MDKWRGNEYDSDMRQVTVDQATQSLADLVDAAVAGEEVVVVNGEHGSVRLVPMESSQGRPQFGSAKGLISMSDDFDAPLEDLREYME